MSGFSFQPHSLRNGRGEHPRRWYRLVWMMLFCSIALIGIPGATEHAVAVTQNSTIPIIVDTDGGVDDALAVAWLLSQTEKRIRILGITTVAGNTTVDQVANNMLLLRKTTDRSDVPILIGAAAPLVQPLSRVGAFVHGPDGLWFTGLQNQQDLTQLSRNVPQFYRDMAMANPGATLLALGPLTNLAKAFRAYPDAMRRFGRIIVLGGAKVGGNRTPIAETNIYNDPDSAQRVLAAGLPITMITLDAFGTLTISQKDIEHLAQKGTPVGQFLAAPLNQYLLALAQGSGQTTVVVPDVVGVFYALTLIQGQAQSALVKVSPDKALTRGQTVIGLTTAEKLPMIASDAEFSDLARRTFGEPNFNLPAALGAILARDPDNAQVVLELDTRQISKQVIKTLTR